MENIVHLVARNPQEMAAAQGDLSTWLQTKVTLIVDEIKQLAEAVREAKVNNWRSSTLENQLSRASQRRLFYEKCLLATQHGYTIIPNIPLDIFAIRTTREKPIENFTNSDDTWKRELTIPNERPQVLELGAGDYKSSQQLVRRGHSVTKTPEGKEVHHNSVRATAFDDIEFPLIAAVPMVMSATQQAMTLRLFDQIGISPQGSARTGDPLIIGQILGEHRGYSGRRTASFLIAWHLDVRAL